MSVDPKKLSKEVAKRRTFAIISHPDAGKTTMTEKLLLWGQAIQVVGEVKGRNLFEILPPSRNFGRVPRGENIALLQGSRPYVVR